MTLRPFTTKKVNDSVTLININDSGSNASDLWSAKQIKDYVASVVAGGSATINNLSSVGDVLSLGASAGDVLTLTSACQWIPKAQTMTVTYTASDVLPAYPMDGFYYGLVYSATGYAWKKYATQAHFVSFDATLSLTPSTLEEGRGVTTFAITLASTNSTDFPLTGYTALTLNGAPVVATSITGAFPNLTYNPSANINSPVSFGLTIEAGANTTNKSANVSYYALKYWGTNCATAITDTEVKAFTSQAFATGKAGTYSFNACAVGRYLWVCWPTSLGTAGSFVVAGLATAFNETTVSVCGVYSAVNNYYCYKSQELQFGTAISVAIT